MRADELYKFSDGTLKTVRDEFHHRILDFRLGYNKQMSRRKWSAIDKRRLALMVKLIDKALLEDLALYDNEGWNDPRDFAKPVKAIFMPHDVLSTSDRRMLELEDQIKLTNEKLVETDVRLVLSSNSNIYPLGVAEDVLVEVTSFVYLVDFMILDIKEDLKKPLILGTPYLTTARAEIKFDIGTISLRFGKSTVQFHISPDPSPTSEERDENKVNTLSVVNERVLEWEEKIKFHHMKELKFEAWKSKYSKSKALTPKDESSSGTSESHEGVTRRKSKKKVSISADDNIIPEPDVAKELGNSMSLTEAEEEEVARRVHATHERLVTEFDPERARRSSKRRPSGIAFRDTSSVLKKKSPDQSQKLKGIQTLSTEEQLAVDMMQALKASIKSSMSQPHAEGLSEGTGVSPRVPDESTVILKTSSEGTEEESEYFEEETADEEIKWLTTDDEEVKKDDDEDDKSIDIEKTNDDKETDDKFVYGDEYVHDDVDEEMKDAEDTETGKDNEEITDAEKTEVTKGDLEQAGKLPLTSSSLSMPSGFGNKFLNLSFNTSLICTIKESVDTEINSLLDIQIQQEVPHFQSLSILTVPILVIPGPTILSPIHEIPSVTPATTLPPHPSITNLTPILQ
ncbi:retrovirus-related pol polyprotein from transposon TNT 1-94 [Tanacetum coccineum]